MNYTTLDKFLREWNNDEPTVLLHTSGSTGYPKPWMAEKERMRRSARMTCDYLGLREGDTALLCMPLDYIAGQMMVVRALERRLNLIERKPDGHPLALPLHGVTGKLFAAMVPLQVWNTLREPEERERLKTVDHLIVGGGSIDPNMETELRTMPGKIWSSYGMTETLSHIALRDIKEEEWYRPLPGVSLSQDKEGCLIVHAPMLCDREQHTHDIVRPHPEGLQHGGFQVIGRSDNVICSGGIKIQIEEVERRLKPVYRDTIQVTSLPHPKFGEVVVFLTTAHIDQHLLRLCLGNPYWMPKRIIQVSQLPLTATGKPDRAEAKRIALTSIAS